METRIALSSVAVDRPLFKSGHDGKDENRRRLLEAGFLDGAVSRQHHFGSWKGCTQTQKQ